MKKIVFLILLSFSVLSFGQNTEVEQSSYKMGVSTGKGIERDFRGKDKNSFNFDAFTKGYEFGFNNPEFVAKDGSVEQMIKAAELFAKEMEKQKKFMQSFQQEFSNNQKPSQQMIEKASYWEGLKAGAFFITTLDGFKVKNPLEVLNSEFFLKGVKDYCDSKVDFTDTELMEAAKTFIKLIGEKSPVPISDE